MKMESLCRLVSGCVLVIGFGAACSATHTGNNSNTNWLARCNDGSSCGADGECLCGVCTRSCSASSDCTAVPGMSCIAVNAAQHAASCASDVTRVCTTQCKADPDCRATSADLRCVSGACIGGSASEAGTVREDAGPIGGGIISQSDAGCPPGLFFGPCLSTTKCKQDADCATLGSQCNVCGGYCGCGSGTSPPPPSDAGTSLPACSWSAALDATDSPRGSCHAARNLLKCNYTPSPGATSVCLSDNSSTCPTGDVSDCQEQCASNEYAIGCGEVGPQPIDPNAVPAPPGCRSMGVTPAGTSYECCPCQP